MVAARKDSAVAFEARYSIWRLSLLALGAVAFVIGGMWIVGVFGPDHPRGMIAAIVGWASIAFFGACAIVILQRLFDRRVIIRIDASGVRNLGWSGDTILWRDIADVHALQIQRQEMLGLELRDRALYPSRSILGRLAGANRAMTGIDAIWLSVTGMNRSFGELADAVARFRLATSPSGGSC